MLLSKFGVPALPRTRTRAEHDVQELEMNLSGALLHCVLVDLVTGRAACFFFFLAKWRSSWSAQCV